MQCNRMARIILAALLFLSLALRLALTLVNREAGDNHMEVARLILSTHRLPAKADCWECFQPKLFHYTVAVAWQGLGLVHAGTDGQILTAQGLNFLAGVMTLVVVWRFVRKIPLPNESSRVCAFALVALNPKLIGISAQATNDALAILFSTLSLYCAWIFFQKQSVRSFLLIGLWLVLGISTKTNAWVTAIAIGLSLLLKAWAQAEGRRRTLTYAGVLVVAVPVLTVANPLTQYLANYRQYGSPVLVNVGKPVPTPFSDQPLSYRPGILSARDGFFTFKFVELLKHPRIEQGYWNYPAHRTSFWTLLYGRAFSVHFDNWPRTWSTAGDDGFWLSRGIFIFALIPTGLLLIGLAREGWAVLQGIVRRDAAALQSRCFGLFALVFAGYVAFVALYAFAYRDFPVIKAVFVFPALLAFPLLFLRGAEWLRIQPSKWPDWGRRIRETGIAILLALFLADITTLIVAEIQNRDGTARAQAQYRLGVALMQKGQIGEAMDHYQKALAIQHYFANAHRDLGGALLLKGRTDEAIIHFQKFVELQPNNAAAHLDLGRLLRQTGQVAEAKTHFEIAWRVRTGQSRRLVQSGLAAGDASRRPLSECRPGGQAGETAW